MLVDGDVTAQLAFVVQVKTFHRQHAVSVLVGLAFSKVLSVFEIELVSGANVNCLGHGFRGEWLRRATPGPSIRGAAPLVLLLPMPEVFDQKKKFRMPC